MRNDIKYSSIIVASNYAHKSGKKARILTLTASLIVLATVFLLFGRNMGIY